MTGKKVINDISDVDGGQKIKREKKALSTMKYKTLERRVKIDEAQYDKSRGVPAASLRDGRSKPKAVEPPSSTAGRQLDHDC